MFKCGQLQCTIAANLFPKLVTGRHVLTLGIVRSIFMDPLSLSFFLSLITSWSKFSEVRSWQNDLSLCFIFNVNAYKSASVDQLSIQVIVRPWMLVSQNSLTRLNFQSDFSHRLPTHPEDMLRFTWLRGGSEVEVDFKSLQSRNYRDCSYKRLSVSRALKCLNLWRRRHDSGWWSLLVAS
jgi:hypothetical protein